MRCIVQRVSSASVSIDGGIVSEIGRGILAFLGVEREDSDGDLAYIVKKLCALRIFSDSQGKMNLSVKDVGGSILVVSQFTLLGDARKGNRPSFITAQTPEDADIMYARCIELINASDIKAVGGRFRTDMKVALVNDGPVTILLDSRKVF